MTHRVRRGTIGKLISSFKVTVISTASLRWKLLLWPTFDPTGLVVIWLFLFHMESVSRTVPESKVPHEVPS